MVDEDQESPSSYPRKSGKRGRPLPPPISPTATELSIEAESSPRSITIDHRVSSSTVNHGARSAAFLLGMSKPVFVLVAAMVMATTGSAAWFFSKWLTIPGLQSQIQELETEVNRLENHVDRLSEEVDDLALENERYASLNFQLNETAADYRDLNNELNASTMRLEALNRQLNRSNIVFMELNDQLAEQNEVHTTMNSQLNETIEDMQLIAGFLNETSLQLQTSFESITNYLAEQIFISRFLVLETLKNTYQQRLQNWDCGFRDFFQAEPFGQDSTLTIPINILPQVLDYVRDQLLSDLCLNRSNFESYLDANYGPLDDAEISTNELLQGTTRYATLAMQYYFPTGGPPSPMGGDGFSIAVSNEDWALASYRCANLPRQFIWS